MSVNPRAAGLRAELERILGVPVRMTVEDDTARLRAPAPEGADVEAWRRVMDALAAADRWGSSDQTGTPEIWADVTEGRQ